MIWQDLLLKILDFAGFSQFSLPLSFVNGFSHVMTYVYQLNGFFPVLTAFANILLILKFSLVCGFVKVVIGKLRG